MESLSRTDTLDAVSLLLSVTERLGVESVMADLDIGHSLLASYLDGSVAIPDDVCVRLIRIDGVLDRGAASLFSPPYSTDGVHYDLHDDDQEEMLSGPVSLRAGAYADEMVGRSMRRCVRLSRRLQEIRAEMATLAENQSEALRLCRMERETLLADLLIEPSGGLGFVPADWCEFPEWSEYLYLRDRALHLVRELRHHADLLRLAGYGSLLPTLAGLPSGSPSLSGSAGSAPPAGGARSWLMGLFGRLRCGR